MANSKKQNRNPIKQNLRQNVPTVERRTVTEVKSSPIPPPEDLSAYKTIDPELVNRIFSMAEGAAKHRHAMETKALATNASNAVEEVKIKARGQVFAIVAVFIFMAVAGLAVINNYPWVGTLISGTTIISVVGAFLSTAKNKNPP